MFPDNSNCLISCRFVGVLIKAYKMKLTNLENRILKQIAVTTPYMFSECKFVYERCKSFDKTIEVLEMACAHGMSYTSILTIMKL